MARRKWQWTTNQIDKLNKVTSILQELGDYKPLTLRQVYYQLVGKGYIENNVTDKYGKEPTEAEIEEAKKHFGIEADHIVLVTDYD